MADTGRKASGVTLNRLNLREIICKNDDCRKLMGYEYIKSGVVAFRCPRCGELSVFRINYPAGQEIIDTLETLSQDQKGGDTKNG